MTLIPGIQISSTFARNSAGPVDGKMKLSTTDRLNLALVQRWLGMLVYDSDLNVWKQLTNNPTGDTTLEDDWTDFLSAGNTGILGPPKLKNIVYVIDGEDEIEGVRYDNINNALTYVTTQIPSINNQWIIQVSTGTYSESFSVPDWVAIKGSGVESTIFNGVIKSSGSPSTNYTKNVIEDCTITNFNFDDDQSILFSNCIVQDGIDFADADLAVLKAVNSIFLNADWTHLDKMQFENCIINGGEYSANNLNIIESMIIPSNDNIILGKTVNIIDSRISYDYEDTNYVTFTNENAVATLYNVIYPTMDGFGTLSPIFNTPLRTYNFYNCFLGTNPTFTDGTFNHFNTTHDSLVETKNIYLDEGVVQKYPINPKDLVNKEYADAISGGIPSTALLKNVVNVNSEITEVAGVTYQTIGAALAYIDTQSPGIDNRWIIQLSSEEYTENVTIPEYIIIRGKDKENSILSGEVRTSGPFPTGPNEGAIITNVTIENLIFDSVNFLILRNCGIIGGSDTIDGDGATFLIYDSDILGGTWTNISQCVIHKSQIFGGTFNASSFNFYRECSFVPYNDIILGGEVKITNSTIFYSSVGTTTFTDEVKTAELENVSYLIKEEHGTYAPTFNTPNRTYNFYNTYLGDATFTAGTFNHYNTVDETKVISQQLQTRGKSAYENVSDMGPDPEDFAHRQYVDDAVGSIDSFTMPQNMVQVDPDSDEIIGERYQSITAALAYVATQTPAEDNRWGVQLGAGEYTDSFSVPEWVAIIGAGKASTVLSGKVESAAIVTGGFSDPDNASFAIIMNCTLENLCFETAGNNWLGVIECFITGGSDTIDVEHSLFQAVDCIIWGINYQYMWNIQFIQCRVFGGTFKADNHFYHSCTFIPEYGDIIVDAANKDSCQFYNSVLYYDYWGLGTLTFANGFNNVIDMKNCSYWDDPTFNTADNTYNFYNCNLGNATYTAGTFNHYGTTDNSKTITESIETRGKSAYQSTSNMGDQPEDFAHKAYVDALLSTKNSVLVNPDELEIVGERYQSIENALTYVATQTPTYNDRWTVNICTGTFTEDITIPDYVLLKGSGLDSTIIDGELTVAYMDSTNDDYWFKNSIVDCRITNLYFDREATLNMSKCYITGGSQTIDAIGSKLNAINCVFTGGTWDDLTHIQILNSTILGGTFGASELHHIQECMIIPKLDDIIFGGNINLIDCRIAYDYEETGNTVTFTDESATAYLFNVVYPYYGFTSNYPEFDTSTRTYEFNNCYMGSAILTSGTFIFNNTFYDGVNYFSQLTISGEADYSSTSNMGNNPTSLTHKQYVDNEISAVLSEVENQFENLHHFIYVDPSTTEEVEGQRYQTIAGALTYIDDNKGVTCNNNRWLIQLCGGTINEDLDLDVTWFDHECVTIRGAGLEKSGMGVTYINGTISGNVGLQIEDVRIKIIQVNQIFGNRIYIEELRTDVSGGEITCDLHNSTVEDLIPDTESVQGDFYNCVFIGTLYFYSNYDINFYNCTFGGAYFGYTGGWYGTPPFNFYNCKFNGSAYEFGTTNKLIAVFHKCIIMDSQTFNNADNEIYFYNCELPTSTFTSGTYYHFGTYDPNTNVVTTKEMNIEDMTLGDLTLTSGTISTTPSNDDDIVRKDYVDDTIGSVIEAWWATPEDIALDSDLSYFGRTQNGIVGETVAFGDFLYKKISDGKWYKCRSIDIIYLPCMVMAVESKTNGQTCILLKPGGYARKDSWTWTSDGTVRILYASHVPGVLSEDQPIISGYIKQAIAIIINSNIIYFYPSIELEEVL